MPTEPCLLLSLADSPPSAAVPGHELQEEARRHVRCLNSAGRWAEPGCGASPLLVWRPAQAAAARAAAEHAAAAHRRAVTVIERSDEAWVEGRDIQIFGDAFEAALRGPAAQSSARARRLRTEADKLEAFCLVVRAASTASDQAAFAEVGQAAAKALRARFGGGSITSAFAWLAGRSGQQALDSVRAGEVEPGSALSVRQLAEATALAQQAELLQAQQA